MRLLVLVVVALSGCAEPATYSLQGFYADGASEAGRQGVQQAITDHGGTATETLDQPPCCFGAIGLSLSACEALRDRLWSMAAVDYVGDCTAENEPIST